MSCLDKRVLVTGATGLIGKELEKPLHAAGFDVYAITIDNNNPENGIHWIKGDLFEGGFIRKTMNVVKPTHLLNMAWATTGDYLSSSVNYKFLEAGIELATTFSENGGKRAVYAGTCFEYKFKDVPINEGDVLEPEKFTYTFCKDALRRVAARIFSEHGVSFGYGRVFYVYGRGEVKSRLTGMVVDHLKRGERVTIRSGELIKDYLYSKDIAGAFAKFLSSDVTGCVNICSGRPISIREFVLSIASEFGRSDLVEFLSCNSDQAPVILGDSTRLRNEVGFIPRYSLEAAISEILATEL